MDRRAGCRRYQDGIEARFIECILHAALRYLPRWCEHVPHVAELVGHAVEVEKVEVACTGGGESAGCGLGIVDGFGAGPSSHARGSRRGAPLCVTKASTLVMREVTHRWPFVPTPSLQWRCLLGRDHW